ncbi:hypothetical protein ACS0TY_025184 [Phlomoides rotata]
MYYCSLILQDETWPWSEELEVLPHLGAQDLVKFYPLMFSRIFVECLVAGNLLPTEAETIIQHNEDVFFKGSDPRSQPLLASQYMTNRIVKLEKGIHYFYSTEGLNPSDENSALVHYIQFYPPTDWLVGSSLPSKFNPERIQSALKELKSTKFEGLADLKEPRYGTTYSLERLNGSSIEQWIERAPAEDLHLPIPNVFIPTDISLKNVSEQAYLKIDFNCPFTGSSPEAVVLTEVFTRLLMDYLNEYAYDAQVAGLYYGVSSADYGFQVTVVGYNHKLAILLETVIQRLANFEVKPDRFAVIKSIAKEYQNMKFQQPYQQAMYYCSLILQDETWSWSEELEVLPHLGAQDLVKFYPLMFSRIFVECLAAGNLLPTEAETIIQHIEDVFFKGSDPRSQSLFASQYMTNRIVKLEKGIHYFYSTEGLNPSDENSALVHYIQAHQDDFKLNVTLQLFVVIAKQPAFHQLRSVEQLGYIAVLMQRNDAGVRGVQVIIQSTVKSNVNALIDMKLEKHKNLREEDAFYWREISSTSNAKYPVDNSQAAEANAAVRIEDVGLSTARLERFRPREVVRFLSQEVVWN